MATERIVNVPINYKVNVVEIERVESASKKADEATQRLRDATQSYASVGASAFKKTGSSIAAMQTDLARLKTQIETTSAADTKRLAALSAQYKALNAQIKEQSKALFEQDKASKQVAASTKGIATEFSNVITAVKAYLAYDLAKEFVQTSLEIAKMSGNLEGVKRAFDRLPNATLLLEELRKSTHGTLTDLQLMQEAIKAQNFGIPLKNLALYLEFAHTRAQQTGQSVDYMVNSIVTGLGRDSIKILDNLQVNIGEMKRRMDEAGISMDEAFGEQVRLEMAKTGGFLETSATQVSQLETKWAKLGVTISKALTSPGLIKFYNSVVDAMTNGVTYAAGGNKALVAEEAKSQALLNVERFKEMHITEEILKNRIKAADIVQQELNTNQSLIGRNNDELKELKVEYDKLINRFHVGDQEELERVKQQFAFYQFKNQMLQESNNILKEYLKSLNEVDKIEKKPTGDPEGRKKPLNFPDTVVDIRFRDAKGNLTKENHGKVASDLVQNQLVPIIDKIHEQLMGIEQGTVFIPVEPFIAMSEWEKAFEANKEAIRETAFSVVQEQINAELMADVAMYDAKIEATKRFYDEQVQLAGDNERAKKELRIKEDREIQKLEKARADREKKAALAGIITNTALGVMKVFAGEGTFFDKLIRAAIVAAQGISQHATASKARYYAKGAIDIDGPGTEKSDSIPAFLSRRESVMTAEETKSSKGILKSIRAKTLNDKVLRDITSGKSGGSAAVGFDDTRLLKKLDEVKNAQPDIIAQQNLIYTQRKKGESYRQIIRKSTMG
jgi:hypothetical protein